MTSAASPSQGFSLRQLCYLVGITFFAAVLRLFKIGAWSFSMDEAAAFAEIVAPSVEVAGGRGMFFHTALRACFEACGFVPAELSEAALRLPMAFFGIATVPLLALTAVRMVGPGSALLASLFLALSPWHVSLSQNLKPDALVLFFEVALLALAYRFFRGPRERRPLVAIGGITLIGLTLLCDRSAWLIGIALLVYPCLVVCRRPMFVLAVASLVVGGVAVILPQSLTVSWPRFSFFYLLRSQVFFVTWPVLIAAIGGLMWLADRQRRYSQDRLREEAGSIGASMPSAGEGAAVYLAVISVVPFVALGSMAAIGMEFRPDDAIVTLPALYLLAGVLIRALAAVFHTGRHRLRGIRLRVLRIVPAAMLLLELIGQDFLYVKKEYGWRPRWKEAVTYIKTRSMAAGSSDVLVLTTNGPSLSYYFDSRRFAAHNVKVEILPIESWTLGAGAEAYLRTVIDRAVAEKRDLWVVLDEPSLQNRDVEGHADDFFRGGLKQVRRLPNWTGPKDMVVLVYHLE